MIEFLRQIYYNPEVLLWERYWVERNKDMDRELYGIVKMSALHKSVLRDWTPQELTPIMYKLLGLHEAPWDELIRTGMDPDTYVRGQCADAVAGVNGKVDVYMDTGVDAPRARADQAACTPDIVRRSVLATYRAGGKGVVFSPAYAGMNLANLDSAAPALAELGLK